MRQIDKQKAIERARRYRQLHPDRVAAGKRRYYAANREKMILHNRAYMKRYRAANREKLNANLRRYYAANREKMQEQQHKRQRRYYKRNHEALLAKSRAYSKNPKNAPRRREWQRQYKRRYPERVREQVRRQIRLCLGTKRVTMVCRTPEELEFLEAERLRRKCLEKVRGARA